MPPRPALLTVLMVLLAAPAAAQSPGEVTGLPPEVAREQATFFQARAAAKAKALQRFDALLHTLAVTKKVTAETRVTLLANLREARDQFRKYGTWADDDRLLDARTTYALAVAKAGNRVSRAYRVAIDWAARSGNPAQAAYLTKSKAEFDRQFPGRDELTPGTRWHGTQTVGADTVPFHLDVHKIEGSLITATAHENVQFAGHPVYQVQGELTGNHVQLAVTKMIQGQSRVAKYDGVLVGNGQMLLNFVAAGPGGRSWGGAVRLNKR